MKSNLDSSGRVPVSPEEMAEYAPVYMWLKKPPTSVDEALLKIVTIAGLIGPFPNPRSVDSAANTVRVVLFRAAEKNGGTVSYGTLTKIIAFVVDGVLGENTAKFQVMELFLRITNKMGWWAAEESVRVLLEKDLVEKLSARAEVKADVIEEIVKTVLTSDIPEDRSRSVVMDCLQSTPHLG